MRPDSRVSIYPEAEVERLRRQARVSTWGWGTAALLFLACSWLLGGYQALRSRESRLEDALTRIEALQAKVEVVVEDYVQAREQQAEVTKLMVTIGELQAAKEDLVRYNQTHRSIPVADAWKPRKPTPP
jgi:hypothetical protein